MIARLLLTSVLLLSLLSPALAQEIVKPDDTVSYQLSAEDWVTTKTAHVTLNVEAAVNTSDAGDMRADMTKAVNEAARGEWRVTSFNRSQDQTGMERWSVAYDARLPESDLNGLADAVKKASKSGMQITVSDIDFTPTLAETEAGRAALRARLLKEAQDQLASLNSTLPDRSYRIAHISFENEGVTPQPRPFVGHPMMAMAKASPPTDDPQEHAQKLTLNAHVIYAAVPPAPTH